MKFVIWVGKNREKKKENTPCVPWAPEQIGYKVKIATPEVHGQ